MCRNQLGEDLQILKFIHRKIRRRDGVESLTTLEEGESSSVVRYGLFDLLFSGGRHFSTTFFLWSPPLFLCFAHACDVMNHVCEI